MAAVLSGITRVLSMSDGDDASWAALWEDLREQYATGDLIEGPSELIAEIDRINNELYATNGLEALADVGVLERQQDRYKLVE